MQKIELKQLRKKDIPSFRGTSFGVPWSAGTISKETAFTLSGTKNQQFPLQSRTLAYWPDGSIKWTGFDTTHEALSSEQLYILTGKESPDINGLAIEKTENRIIITGNKLTCELPLQGNIIISKLAVQGKQTLNAGKLICLVQDQPNLESTGSLTRDSYECLITNVEIERNGPLACVVRIEGKHQNSSGKSLLPFIVRLYFSADSAAVKIVHSFIFDADANTQFIAGLGLTFHVPLSDDLQDRHIRFSGTGKGLYGECVKQFSGLRRHAGDEALQAQTDGRKCPPVEQLPERVGKRIHLIPAYNDFTLSQLSSNSFSIKKRTGKGQCWLQAGQGTRSTGFGYLGGPEGGMAFGIRNFWQSYPASLSISNAATETGTVNMWLWSPEGPAMDMRFYHDGMGMNNTAEQMEGLEILYEDYEPGFDEPKGIARTSELHLFACATTPDRQTLAAMAESVAEPTQLVCTPEHYHNTGVFGRNWGLPDTSTPTRKKIEHHLEWLVRYYRTQREQHDWYGFWDFGDVMHSYDKVRHTWKYDVGGYAWDNSELSTDLWLWYNFLRTGCRDTFDMAEAMTRHTGEVDVYHAGPMQGLGSRHNVRHWGCSAKQVRISTAIFRRFYYFLTGDERTGDLMTEVKDADHKLLEIVPLRKYPELLDKSILDQGKAIISIGTDWCSFAVNWLTQWERTGDTTYRDKIVKGMEAVGATKNGWFASGTCIFDPATAELTPLKPDRITISHLQAVFGAPELHAEILELIPDQTAYKEAWLEYCSMYNSDPAEFEKRYGVPPKGVNLVNAHSRITAFAGHMLNDKKLKLRAWKEFIEGERDSPWEIPFADDSEHEYQGPDVLNPVVENPYVSTNDTAQWSLAAIQNLALIGDVLEEAAGN